VNGVSILPVTEFAYKLLSVEWLKCNRLQGNAAPFPTSRLWLKALPHLKFYSADHWPLTGAQIWMYHSPTFHFLL